MKIILLILFLGLSNIVFGQDIFQAARENNLATLEAYKQKGGDLNVRNQKGYNLLILAVYNNQPETVKWLIDNKILVDNQDDAGNTALMGACFKGNADMVRLLLEKGANPNILNKNQANALFFAATFGHEGIVKLLLTYKTNKSQKDQFGKTPLDYAINQGNESIIKLLQ
ncbi:MAG: ankyrin repeat domain-containing protein [Raineya sp.]|jgi:hypothetical protein|nr:ankyrin repeat domain-containing protein [Raineya sp.]